MKKWLAGLIILTAMIGIAGYFKFRPYLEYQLEASLQNAGLVNPEIELSRLGFNGALFKEIRFGTNNPIVLNNVTLNYKIGDLINGRLDEILLQDLSITALQLEDRWKIYGLEGLNSGAPDPSSNPLSTIPTKSAQIEQIPLRRLAVQNSVLNLQTLAGTALIPFEAVWEKNASPPLTLQSKAIELVMAGANIHIDNAEIKAGLEDNQWQGNWNLNAVQPTEFLPEFTAQGSLTLNNQMAQVNGTFNSIDQIYAGSFVFDYQPETSPAMALESDVQIDMPIENGTISLPVSMQWNPDNLLMIKAKEGIVNWQSGDMSFNTNTAAFAINQNETGFAGTWKANDINIEAPVPVPVLQANGKITIANARVDAGGTITSDDKKWYAKFNVIIDNANKASEGVRIEQGRFPWNDGVLSVQKIWMPFVRTKPVPIKIDVQKVDLETLMRALTGDRIQAYGLVSGTINMVIDEEGNVEIKDANLAAEGPGTIVMPPETIPASNDQVNLVKDIMQDLRYKILNISAEPDTNGELSLKLSVEGNNPKVYDGHPVKLNINLTGNLIDFFEQNIMLLTRPDKFLKDNQYDNEKN